VGSVVGVSAALHACRAAEGFGMYEANRLLNPLRDDLGAHGLVLQNGDLVARDAPGHGGEPDASRLEAWAQRRPNA
jgi:L-alanine-DL-glutamate epimerase-like enolase superfamily enzyme